MIASSAALEYDYLTNFAARDYAHIELVGGDVQSQVRAGYTPRPRRNADLLRRDGATIDW
jgi:hypothetical protein